MSWITEPLGKVASVLNGTTPDSSNPAFWNGDSVWVTPTDLGKLNGHVVATSERMITGLGRTSCNLPRVPAGAVVMSSRAPIGHLAIAGCDLHTNQGCKSFVCGSALDPWFLYFTLMHRKSEIQALGSGATFAEVSKSVLEDFEIPFPEDMDDQRRIAAELKAQLAEVETTHHAAQVQAEDIALLRSRLLNDVFATLDTSPLRTLGDHAATTSGSTPPRGNKRYWEQPEIPWVKTGEVAFRSIIVTKESISKAALAECSLTLLPPGSVLVAMIGQGKTRGQSAILEISATTNQNCFAILPNNTWDPYFLYYWFVASYRDLRNLSADRGGNQSALNGALLNALEIPAPDKSEQQHVVQHIKAALTEVDALHKANKVMMADLEQLPQRLLAQAFKE